MEKTTLFIKKFMISQLILAIVYGISQAFKMFETTEGLSTSMFFFSAVYLIINYFLLKNAYKIKKTEELWYLLRLHEFGIAIYLILTLLMLMDSDTWDLNDWYTVFVIGISFLSVLPLVIKAYGKKHPYVKGTISALFKGIPLLFLAYKISQNGGGGLPWLALLVAHVMTLMRIIHTLLALKKDKESYRIRATLYSEYFNEFSWLVVTIVWYIN